MKKWLIKKRYHKYCLGAPDEYPEGVYQRWAEEDMVIFFKIGRALIELGFIIAFLTLLYFML